MAGLALADRKESIAQDLSVLREYARRAIIHDEELTLGEAEDLARRMQEFLAVGSSFQLTYKEMVLLIFRGSQPPERECGCPSCRSRGQR